MTESEALVVLRELIAVRRGDGDLVDRLQREQAAWDRAGKLIEKADNAGLTR
jgi:YD repeat-containing protein